MRRIAALVLPHLACELAARRALSPWTSGLGVILEREGSVELTATAVLDAVDEQAWRYGVRPGMKVTEASALVAGFGVERITYAELEGELGRVAELVTNLAPTVSLRLDIGRDDEGRRRDTVWLDITGAAHLVGGEEELVDELVQRAAMLGHRGRAAIADGPRIAEALARFAPLDVGCPIAGEGRGAAALAELPLAALPLDTDTVGWFLRLGLMTVSDLARLPKAALAARIPARAPLVLDLLAGRDEVPLVPFEPPRVIVEEATFDEGVGSTEGLIFVLRGMASRMSARLTGRGEACTRLELALSLDRSMAALAEPASGEGLEVSSGGARFSLAVDLPAPLAAEADLLRALRARIERIVLPAPVVAVRLVIPAIARARRVQLDLSRGTAVNPDALPALLAELSAEIGAERLGVLSVRDAHVPAARSALVPATLDDTPFDREALTCSRSVAIELVTRLLPAPVPLGGHFGMQRVVAVDQALYAAEPRRFLQRLDDIGWWTPSPVSRDYLTAWFVCGDKARGGPPAIAGEGLVYVDRRKGEAFLEGWLE